MKNILIALFSILIGLTPQAHAGNEAGGGGIAENNILFAYWNLEKFIDLCRASPGCGLTGEEDLWLQRIRENLAQERLVKNQIVFRSGDKHPGFFVLEGLVRLARTGYRVGDVIYVNTDLLYPGVTVNMVGVPKYGRPFDIPQAISMLVHELGHHLGIKEHTELDLLGSKVNSIMRTNTQELDGGPEERHLVATAINYGGVSLADFVVRDDSKVISLLPTIQKGFLCPDEKPLRGYWVWNLHWKTARYLPGGKNVRPLRFRAQLICGDEPNAISVPREGELELIAKPSKEKILEWSEGPIPFKAIDCKAAPSACP